MVIAVGMGIGVTILDECVTIGTPGHSSLPTPVLHSGSARNNQKNNK